MYSQMMIRKVKTLMVRISVIVPVYNVEKYIERAVQSIINQTIKDIEIILVNDGSDDSSGLICDKLSQQNSNIRVMHQINSGVSAARNKGIEIAKGDYIGFIDADDEIEPDMYEFLINEIIENKADISMCGIMIKYLNGVTKLEYGTNKRYVLDNEEAIYTFLKGSILNISMNTKLIKRELFYRCRFDENIRINEDKLMLFQCLINANRIVSNDDCKYVYIKRFGSASEERFSTKYFDIILVASEIKKIVENTFPQYINLAKRNYFLSNLYVYRMLSRKNQYKNFYKEYLGLKKYIQREDYSSFKSLMPTNKNIELTIIRTYPFLYRYLLKVFDLFNRGI